MTTEKLKEKADEFLNEKKYEKALGLYDKIISDHPLNAAYYTERACIYKFLDDLENAIVNTSKAIELNPERSINYYLRGSIYLKKLAQDSQLIRSKRHSILEQIIEDYSSVVERNPNFQDSWLHVIQAYLLLHNWKKAVEIYIKSSPYVLNRKYKIIRAWLGCLALCFAGDPIEELDEKPLWDSCEQIHQNNWNMAMIEQLLHELSADGFDLLKVNEAKRIHNMLLERIVDKK